MDIEGDKENEEAPRKRLKPDDPSHPYYQLYCKGFKFPGCRPLVDPDAQSSSQTDDHDFVDMTKVAATTTTHVQRYNLEPQPPSTKTNKKKGAKVRQYEESAMQEAIRTIRKRMYEGEEERYDVVAGHFCVPVTTLKDRVKRKGTEGTSVC